MRYIPAAHLLRHISVITVKKPVLILIGGLPASGKTTLANALAERLGAFHLNSDAIRAKLSLRGHYDASSKQLVYDALFQTAETLLNEGNSVIVDSTFYKRKLRLPWKELAIQLGVPGLFIFLEIPDEVARERLSTPRPDSEATWEVYQQLKATWEKPIIPALYLNAHETPLEEMVEQVQKDLEKQE